MTAVCFNFNITAPRFVCVLLYLSRALQLWETDSKWFGKILHFYFKVNTKALFGGKITVSFDEGSSYFRCA